MQKVEQVAELAKVGLQTKSVKLLICLSPDFLGVRMLRGQWMRDAGHVNVGERDSYMIRWMSRKSGTL